MNVMFGVGLGVILLLAGWYLANYAADKDEVTGYMFVFNIGALLGILNAFIVMAVYNGY